MEKKVAQYKVFITKDHETGTGKAGYVAYVPKLGIADDGYTIEEALKNIRALTKFHLESLMTEGEIIPAPDAEETLVTSTIINFTPIQARRFQNLAFA